MQEEDEDEDAHDEEEEDEQYEVERIVAKVLRPGIPHYVVQWKGFDDESDYTEEPMSYLMDCQFGLKT